MNSVAHLLIQEFTLAPGDEWTSQVANWWFLHISAGESYWLGPEKARSLSAGEALIIAPAVSAVIRASQLTETTIKGFTFVPEDLLGLLTLAERNSFETELATNSEPVRFLPPAHPVTRQLSALLPAPPGCDALRQRAQALAIVAAAFDSKAPLPQPSAGLGTSARQRFRQLVSEMPEVELIHSTPAELARLCRCSTSYFGRLFREHFGTRVRAMQDDLRLLRACQLLRATESEVAVIAQGCGFANTQTLNLLFKARFGVWPSSWRQQQQVTGRPNGNHGAALPASAGPAKRGTAKTLFVTDS